MANVVRDPKQHPDAIFPDLTTNTVRVPKGTSRVRLRQPLEAAVLHQDRRRLLPPAVSMGGRHKQWRPYFVANGTDWWASFYPPDNMQRPTGPTCDGCHSVGYDIHTKQVAEWNVGCERCHGPGSEHVAQKLPGHIVNPAHLTDVAATDSCIQCHSQGRPRTIPIEGKVLRLAGRLPRRPQACATSGQLEEHTLGKTDVHAFRGRHGAQEPDAGQRLRRRA